MATSLLALHPDVFVRDLLWRRDAGTTSTLRRHAMLDTATYRGSVVEAIHLGRRRVRIRLAEEEPPYPALVELRSAGGTDYVIHALDLSDGRRSYVSFATDAADGFSARDLRRLASLIPALGLRLELDAQTFAAASLLEVYLGRNAARRVLAGAFRRGAGEPIDAAIWYADMRGFTTAGDRLSSAELVRLLDDFFDRVADPIEACDGEILKFVGDAVVAVFPVRDGGEAAACARALRSADEALMRLARWNADRGVEDVVAMGVGLHLGQVMYGNIGARERLDFTVIGASVNEVCRIEAMCKALDVPLLVTERFRRCLPETELVSMGTHRLRGVAGERELFTLPRFVESSGA